MEKLLLDLIQKGGPLGILIAVIIILVGIGLLARQKGWLVVGDKTRSVHHEDLTSINQQLTSIDQRLEHVETDLQHRPTKDEFHAMDKLLAQFGVQLKNIDRSSQATSEAVTNINNFMREASMRIKGSD